MFSKARRENISHYTQNGVASLPDEIYNTLTANYYSLFVQEKNRLNGFCNILVCHLGLPNICMAVGLAFVTPKCSSD